MDKKETAEFLGVTIRAVERYQQQGKLTPRYEKGKTTKKVVYDDGEVQQLKDELESPATIIDISPTNKPSSTELAKRGDMSPLINALAEALSGKEGKGKRPDVPIEAKPLLKISEAQMLTGLSRETLKDAIERKKLKAKKEGKAFRITRKSLEEYIQKNF